MHLLRHGRKARPRKGVGEQVSAKNGQDNVANVAEVCLHHGQSLVGLGERVCTLQEHAVHNVGRDAAAIQ